MPDRLTELGPDERQGHHLLPADVPCWFWGEYTPWEHTGGRKWAFSPTNQLISNLKKGMDKRGTHEWRHKEAACHDVARAYANFFRWQEMHQQGIAIVPIPSSKARTDPMYDPRMRAVLQGVANNVGIQLDIRDCLSFSGRYAASHLAAQRPSPDELYADLTFDSVVGRVGQRPAGILLCDDVLTRGAHFAAVTRKLRDEFGAVSIRGCFIARTVIPNPFADIVIEH